MSSHLSSRQLSTSLTGTSRPYQRYHGYRIHRIEKERTYLIFVFFFTKAKFLENKICTEKTRKLRQNTQKTRPGVNWAGVCSPGVSKSSKNGVFYKTHI